MVKPTNAQLRELIELRVFVIEVMNSMGVWSEELLTKLTTIELGVLRKNATQRHGVTRWRQGIKNPTIPEEVQVIELHPNCFPLNGNHMLLGYCITNLFMP